MARTIQEIYGDTGMVQNANKDIFADTEAKSKESLDKSLQTLRSIDEEAQKVKGFQGNTFLDASRMQQEQGIISSLETQLAGARLSEDIKERDFGRSIVGAGYNADLQNDFADQNLNRSKSLATTQYELGEKAADSNIGRQEKLIETQAKYQKDILGEQTDLEIAKMKESGQIQSEFAKLSTGLQSSLNVQMQGLNALTSDQQFTKTKELANINFENSMASVMKQYDLGELSANSGLQRSIQQLDAQTDKQLQVIDTQWKNGEISADNAVTRQKQVIAFNFDQQADLASQQMKDQYKFLTGEEFTADAQGELAIKYNNQLQLLDKQLEIEKETALAEIDLQQKWTIMAESIKSLPAIAELLKGTNPLDKITGGVASAAYVSSIIAAITKMTK